MHVPLVLRSLLSGGWVGSAGGFAGPSSTFKSSTGSLSVILRTQSAYLWVDCNQFSFPFPSTEGLPFIKSTFYG
jgi:hypothetical protein